MPWAKFVSWYSSTSTWRKRRATRSRTCGLLVQQPERAQDQVAEVERAALGEQAVVVGVEARELELARGRARARRRPSAVVGEPLGVARGSRPRRPSRPSAGRCARRSSPAAAPGCRGSRGGAAVSSSMRSSSSASRSAGVTGREERVDAGLERLVAGAAACRRRGTSRRAAPRRATRSATRAARASRPRPGEEKVSARIASAGSSLLDEPGEARGQRAGLAGARRRRPRAAARPGG